MPDLIEPFFRAAIVVMAVFVLCRIRIHAALAPQTAAMMTDHVLIAADIPVGACRRLRNGLAEAEVCPALWDAAHLIVNDPGSSKPAA